jgi:hypothetical protein
MSGLLVPECARLERSMVDNTTHGRFCLALGESVARCDRGRPHPAELLQDKLEKKGTSPKTWYSALFTPKLSKLLQIKMIRWKTSAVGARNFSNFSGISRGYTHPGGGVENGRPPRQARGLFHPLPAKHLRRSPRQSKAVALNRGKA